MIESDVNWRDMLIPNNIDSMRYYCSDYDQQLFYNQLTTNPKPLTLVLGAVCSDGVCMIADKKFTDKFGDLIDYRDKIIGDQKHVVVGFSGNELLFDDFRMKIYEHVSNLGSNGGSV